MVREKIIFVRYFWNSLAAKTLPPKSVFISALGMVWVMQALEPLQMNNSASFKVNIFILTLILLTWSIG